MSPRPGHHAAIGRDYEYKRHGTFTLMADLDLVNGHIHSAIVNRHRSREFVAFLKQLNASYPENTTIRIVLDNHCAHISKETRSHLATIPNRFEFVFTPKHGCWLNLLEPFFEKMARTLLRGIRVQAKAELKDGIQRYIHRINQDPLIYRWQYRLDEISVV